MKFDYKHFEVTEDGTVKFQHRSGRIELRQNPSDR